MRKQRKCGYFLQMKCILWIIILCSSLCLSGCGTAKAQKEGFQVVTSFYPMYIMAWNLTDGIDGVSLVNMAEPSTGCLHDYQLRPKDLVCLDGADVFLTNGGGMENFLADALEAYPELKVYEAIDALADEDLIESEGHHHEDGEECHEHHHHEGEDEENINPHTWMDPTLYRKELAYFCQILMENDPAHAAQYEKNYRIYDEKLQDLETNFAEEGIQALILHESFPYLLRTCKITLAGAAEVEKDSGFAAKEMRDLVDTARACRAEYILSDSQYSGRISELLAQETGMQVWKLDSAVSGEYEKDAYLNSMKHNYAIISEGIRGTEDEN